MILGVRSCMSSKYPWNMGLTFFSMDHSSFFKVNHHWTIFQTAQSAQCTKNKSTTITNVWTGNTLKFLKCFFATHSPSALRPFHAIRFFKNAK